MAMRSKAVRKRLFIYGIFVGVLVGVLWFAWSLKPRPISNGTRSLAGFLVEDFDVRLPSTVVVNRAAKAGGMDPGYFYEIQISGEAVEAFSRELKSAMKRVGSVTEETDFRSQGLAPYPEWWPAGEEGYKGFRGSPSERLFYVVIFNGGMTYIARCEL